MKRDAAFGAACALPVHSMPDELADLERRIDYRFENRSLLEQALTHSSYVGEGKAPAHYQRLEFLGDAVLGMIASEMLLTRFPNHPEGRLTKLRARLVCTESLCAEALELELGRFLRLGAAEEGNGGRRRTALLADAVEALIAAVYSDGGLTAARALVGRLSLRPQRVSEAEADLGGENPKSALQEALQRRGMALAEYRLVGEDGPPHDRAFEVEIRVGDLYRAAGVGSTKKSAEKAAAARALGDLDSWLPAERSSSAATGGVTPSRRQP